MLTRVNCQPLPYHKAVALCLSLDVDHVDYGQSLSGEHGEDRLKLSWEEQVEEFTVSISNLRLFVAIQASHLPII